MKTRGFAFLSFLVLTLNLPAAAQPPSDVVIGSIQVSGQKRFTPEQIIASSGLKVGATFRTKALDDAVNRLGDTGAFNYVRYNFHLQAGKVAVELVVQEAPHFHMCVFDNFVWFSNEELYARLHKNIPLFNASVPESGNMVDAVASELEKVLKEKGISTTVTHTPFGALGDLNWVYTFDADQVKVSVVSINFDGATTIDMTALQKEAAPLLNRNYTVTEFKLFSRNTFLPFYRDRGYLQAVVGDSYAKPVDASHCLADCNVTVTFPVTEGPVYHWNAASWSGDLLVPSPHLEKLMGFKLGEIASAKKVDSGFDLVRKEYMGKGYIEMKMSPDPAFDDSAKTVTYRIAIAQGMQFKMGEFQTKGFSPAVAEKIKAAWRLKTGDIYDGNYLQEFFRKDLGTIFTETKTRVPKIDVRYTPHRDSQIIDVSLEVK